MPPEADLSRHSAFLEPKADPYAAPIQKRIDVILLAVAIIFLAIFVSASAHAQNLYWDGNGNTVGAGTTPTGTWDTGVTARWNTNINGNGNPGVWTASGTAFFSAGTDATGAYTVTVSGLVVAGGIRVEEGSPTFAGTTSPSLRIMGGGLQISSGAGTVSFDSSLPISISASQNWVNDSANLFSVASNISSSAIGGLQILIPQGTGNTSISGTISNGTGNIQLQKAGAGTLTLSGTNTYTGATNVNAGRLLINGNQSAATGLVTVNSGGTLGGGGTTGGRVVVASGGILAPGATTTTSTAIFNVGDGTVGALTLQAGSSFAIDLNGTTAGTGYDRVSVTGGVSLAGALNVTSTITPTTDRFFIIVNDGIDAVSGTFSSTSGLPAGYTVYYTGDFASGSLTGGNDVVLAPIPEPGTWIGAVLALASIGFMQLRKRSRAGGRRLRELIAQKA